MSAFLIVAFGRDPALVEAGVLVFLGGGAWDVAGSGTSNAGFGCAAGFELGTPDG